MDKLKFDEEFQKWIEFRKQSNKHVWVPTQNIYKTVSEIHDMEGFYSWANRVDPAEVFKDILKKK